ncbi:MAG: energy-coupling factor ABC transporter permease [Campylobacterales bacterium]|nr:energy-coupling factor ABC transporter permease [Campylobacterales bacterium]
MHIPDGFISPQTYLPALALCGALWAFTRRRVALEPEQLPFIAGVSAISFTLMLIALPLPGGTSVHLGGVAIISLLFGPWMGFAAISMVLLIAALLFGEGGITAYGVNVLAIAFGGSFASFYMYRLLRRWERLAILAAGWISVVVPSFIIALALGIQPLIASEGGKPLYFPFGLHVTLPAIVLPHLLLGLLEAVVTLSVVRYLRRRFVGVLGA